MTYTITPIPEFNDNYIWLIGHEKSRQAIVVDPGAYAAVHDYCTTNNWNITAIWITHGHHDHIGGVKELAAAWQCATYGPEASNENYNHKLVGGDEIPLFGIPASVQIIATPGHTLDHICYFSAIGLFCGDTLFAGGCGRAFECEPSVLYHSLQKLAKLPPETKVYAAHEYTLNNLLFAQTVDPDNKDLIERIAQTKALRNKNLATLPSCMELELATNPFLRCDKPAIIEWAANSGKNADHPADVFAALRQAKDAW